MQRFALTLALLLAVLPWASSRQRRREHPKHQEARKKLLCGARAQLERLPGRGQESAQTISIMVGKSPYASEQYAKAAIETFPECKSAKKDKAVAGARPGAAPLDYP